MKDVVGELNLGARVVYWRVVNEPAAIRNTLGGFIGEREEMLAA